MINHQCVEIFLSIKISFRSQRENVFKTFAMSKLKTAVRLKLIVNENISMRDEEMDVQPMTVMLTSFTHLPVQPRKSDSRSAGAAGLDADCRGESADAAVDREME